LTNFMNNIAQTEPDFPTDAVCGNETASAAGSP
jgi:hypothetical protein